MRLRSAWSKKPTVESAWICVQALEDRTVPAVTVTNIDELEQAIIKANLASTKAADRDIILAKNTNYNYTTRYDNTDNALPVITRDIRISVQDFETDVTRRSTFSRDVNAVDRFRFFEVASTGTLTIRGLFLTSGRPPLDEDGGAIRVTDGRLIVHECTFSNNTAERVDLDTSIGKANGGAIFSSGRVEIFRSTFGHAGDGYTSEAFPNAGNFASTAGGALALFGRARIENSTFHGNQAGIIGGGMYLNLQSATPQNEINFCTITQNFTIQMDNPSAKTFQGAGIASVTNNIIVRNTIISNTYKANFAEIAGTIGEIDHSYVRLWDNFSVDGMPVDPNMIPTDIKTSKDGKFSLGAIQDNGGRTNTRLPSKNSIFIDNGEGPAPVFDQRGLPRVVGKMPDIGAVERQLVEVSPTPVPLVEITDNVDNVHEGQVLQYTIIVRNPTVLLEDFVRVDVDFKYPISSTLFGDIPVVTWWTSLENNAKGAKFGYGGIHETIQLPPSTEVRYYATIIVPAADTINVHGMRSPVADYNGNGNIGKNSWDDINTVYATEELLEEASPQDALVAQRYTDNVITVGSDRGRPAEVIAYDASSGAIRYRIFPYGEFQGGARVATGDVTGDGVRDIIVSPGPGGGPHIRVYDGRTGFSYRQFFAYAPNFTGGVYVASGNVLGNGQAEVITAAGAGGGPHVRVFNLENGVQVPREFFAYALDFRAGVTVAAGDVNGDGLADIVTGAGPGGGPHVRVFDAATNQVINDFFAYGANFRGGVFVTAGDMTGDGVAEVITAPISLGGPHVRIFAGLSPNVIKEFFAQEYFFTGGIRLGYVNPLNAPANQKNQLLISSGPGAPTRLRRLNFNGVDLTPQVQPFGNADLMGAYVG